MCIPVPGIMIEGPQCDGGDIKGMGSMWRHLCPRPDTSVRTDPLLSVLYVYCSVQNSFGNCSVTKNSLRATSMAHGLFISFCFPLLSPRAPPGRQRTLISA